MPRGRRRKADKNKEPLVFEESPKHIVHKTTSPVFAVDDPLTADVVSVDSNTSFPWVSPQFHSTCTPGGRRVRRSRRNQQDVTSRSRHPSDKCNQSTVRSTNFHQLKGFVPLVFESHPKRSAATSPIEEIDISVEDVEVTVAEDPQPHQPAPDESECSESPMHRSILAKKTCRKKKQRKANTRNRKIPLPDSSLFRSILQESHDCDTDNNASLPCVSRAPVQSDSLGDMSRESPQFSRHRKVAPPLDSIPTESASPGTQRRPLTNCAGRLNKRLFVPGDSCNDTDSSIDKKSSADNRNSPIKSRTNDCDIPVPAACSTPLHETEPLLQSPAVRARTSTPYSNHCGSFHTPKDRGSSARKRDLISYILSPKRSPGMKERLKECKILAYDTPVEDYGLPVRLRRKKCRFNKTLDP